MGSFDDNMIRPGTEVLITDFEGTRHQTTALSPVERRAGTFDIVWVQSPSTGRRLPWPEHSVESTSQPGIAQPAEGGTSVT